MKLAFRYFSPGFERIAFMIAGADITILLGYLFWCQYLYGTTIPMLPVGYATGDNTLAGAMVIAGLMAIASTLSTILILAGVAWTVGYIRNYLAVLSYYDEEKYAGYKKYRAPQTMAWLMNFSLGKEAEQARLAAIEDCKRRCKAIKEEIE